MRAASGGSLSPLGWACMDAGRWDDALEAAAEVDDFSTGYQMDIVGPSPRGAPVRRTAGSSDTPDSSQNTMAARRRRAPARILGPVLSHPTGDRPLVTLDGAAGGPLQPVVQPVAQQLPDVAAMVGDPVSRSITVVMRSRVQWSVWKPCARAPCRSAWSMAASWGRQACGRPDGAGAAQCLQPTCLPAAGVLSGDARLAGDLGLGAAGGKQYNNRTSRLPAMPGLTSLAPTWRRIR